jgi:hypothetical protein
MSYIKACEIVLVSQIDGYTDRTAILQGEESNHWRMISFYTAGFYLEHYPSGLGVTPTSTMLALQYTLNAN